MKIWQWTWMPTIVFLLGILSVILLLLVDRINARQRIDFDIVDAIMDAQISTATAHLWLEHVLSGDGGVKLSTSGFLYRSKTSHCEPGQKRSSPCSLN